MTMFYTESEEHYLAEKRRKQEEEQKHPLSQEESAGDRLLRLIRMASQS